MEKYNLTKLNNSIIGVCLVPFLFYSITAVPNNGVHNRNKPEFPENPGELVIHMHLNITK